MSKSLRQRTSRTEIHSRVTAQIVTQLEQGVRPWIKPWNSSNTAGRITRPLRHNGQPYNGINVLMLWSAAEAHGFSAPFWLTFQQALELGGHVRKGERGSPVIYAATFTKPGQTPDGGETPQEISFLKEYTVFNAEQCCGLPHHFQAQAAPPVDHIRRIEHAEAFFRHTGADIRIGGNQAFYALVSDHIQMPPLETFRDSEAHAATLGHEMTHWTRSPTRLQRNFYRQRWGDAGYAMEELVAELGSAFLCADLAITPEVRDDHASYIDSWLQVLKNDQQAVFSAASHASKAVEYLHALQPQAET